MFIQYIGKDKYPESKYCTRVFRPGDPPIEVTDDAGKELVATGLFENLDKKKPRAGSAKKKLVTEKTDAEAPKPHFDVDDLN